VGAVDNTLSIFLLWLRIPRKTRLAVAHERFDYPRPSPAACVTAYLKTSPLRLVIPSPGGRDMMTATALPAVAAPGKLQPRHLV
jgi:hypothetical protein